MNPEDIVHFYPSKDLFHKAATVFEEQKKMLETILPVGIDIQHVGGCSVPGLMGKFDVDLQIRPTADQFEQVVELMKMVYTPNHPELWTDSFAIFSNYQEFFVDLMVTTKDGPYDDFYKVRDSLKANPKLVEEFNALKMQYEGRPYAEYREAKNAFFGGNGHVKFLD